MIALLSLADESDEEGERPSRRRRLAERAAEGADDEEVSNYNQCALL